MNPSLSVIVFTTTSGAGYGLIAVAGLLNAVFALPDAPWFGGATLLLALALKEPEVVLPRPMFFSAPGQLVLTLGRQKDLTELFFAAGWLNSSLGASSALLHLGRRIAPKR